MLETLAPGRLTPEALQSALELQDRIEKEVAREESHKPEEENQAGVAIPNKTKKQNGES